jgi:hypothetical protein
MTLAMSSPPSNPPLGKWAFSIPPIGKPPGLLGFLSPPSASPECICRKVLPAKISQSGEPGGALARASASLDSVCGLIESNWQLKNDHFHWHVTIPPTAAGTAYIPTTDYAKVQEDGVVISDDNQTTVIDRKNKILTIELLPGSYDFLSPFSLAGESKCDCFVLAKQEKNPPAS